VEFGLNDFWQQEKAQAHNAAAIVKNLGRHVPVTVPSYIPDHEIAALLFRKTIVFRLFVVFVTDVLAECSAIKRRGQPRFFFG
jgi:hypothetical protein